MNTQHRKQLPEKLWAAAEQLRTTQAYQLEAKIMDWRLMLPFLAMEVNNHSRTRKPQYFLN